MRSIRGRYPVSVPSGWHDQPSESATSSFSAAPIPGSCLSGDLLGRHDADLPCDAEHPVCAAHHLWPMRHADPSHLQQPKLRVDLALLFHVEMGGAFVQKQDLGL